jgi:streptomycin 3"-adenylyltransferase
VAAVVEHLRSTRPAGLVGVWLHGSATAGGLRPDSDVDLLSVTTRPLSAHERDALVGVLHTWSGRRATNGPGRPIELASVVRSDVVPWRTPPTLDLLYGEWLREAGPEGPGPAPDLVVLLAAARESAVPLVGPALAEVVPEVPVEDLLDAVRACLPPLLEDLVGDERNVLLTLARMVVTVRTGRVVPKDVAAEEVAGLCTPATQDALRTAAAAYRGDAEGDWSEVPAREAADELARMVGSGTEVA